MALKGQLSDFNLAEILQLIAGQQKSGFLILEAQREMVFVFDKGVLISTRDRRNVAPDPLETYLKSYGFFDDSQWKHIDFIRANSSLDLTEILLSEQLMDEAALERVLKSIAQEMAHRGMKLRRGRYHFTATKDTPPGVRGRYRLDVQAVLMEAARRLDEEPLLLEALPSQAVTFTPGSKTPAAEAISPTGHRILDLALAGHSLGRIIRSAQTDSFTVRELLRDFCREGYLAAHIPGADATTESGGAATAVRRTPAMQLRSLALTLVVAGGLAAAGGFRWWPVIAGNGSEIGLAVAPAASGEAVIGDGSRFHHEDPVARAASQLRLRQLRADVVEALELYRYDRGQYPSDLGDLVGYGLLTEAMRTMLVDLGWSYSLLSEGRGYSLAT